VPYEHEPSYIRDIPQLAVAVALFSHDGRVLLQQFKKDRYAGSWGFPGGKVDPGETPALTAHRELYEESGIGSNEVSLCKARFWSYDRYEETDEHFICVYYEGETIPPVVHAEVTEPDKTRKWLWTPPDEVLRLWELDALLPGCAGILGL
jgi:mutator protein MutT